MDEITTEGKLAIAISHIQNLEVALERLFNFVPEGGMSPQSIEWLQNEYRAAIDSNPFRSKGSDSAFDQGYSA